MSVSVVVEAAFVTFQKLRPFLQTEELGTKRRDIQLISTFAISETAISVDFLTSF